MDYETRTHHSNMDVYDRIQAGDLMQASTIIASFVYNTANRPEMLPRKPLPEAPAGTSRAGRSTFDGRPDGRPLAPEARPLNRL